MYFGYFLLTFLLSAACSLAVFFIMRALHIVDVPAREKRKIHRKSIPLGGGLAIFTSFFLMVLLVVSKETSFGDTVTDMQLWGLFVGGLILMVGGLLDDIYTLPPIRQLVFPLLAALSVILSGIRLTEITNPLGGSIHLDWLVLADMIVFFWLFGMMFTTKLLDGLDGLVTGMVTIGSCMIFFLSIQKEWYQPDVALLSIVFAGACAGFLLWNFHPAKIFLGQGGSLFTGFMLGALAIISGGKIATTLLVMGVPILDMIRVIVERIRRKRSIFLGDREHLHFQLIASGLTHRQTVLLFYTISFLFGITTLFLQSRQKLIALLFLFVLMMLSGIWLSRKTQHTLVKP
ncbi:MAG TPA: MraY family glycosyltransferase [Candidatus Kapabacteria bacterium]|nr:MraY family glycosyltransferase [Candidatus Kapabacteria bacterium]